jgi:hypothetical protein
MMWWSRILAIPIATFTLLPEVMPHPEPRSPRDPTYRSPLDIIDLVHTHVDSRAFAGWETIEVAVTTSSSTSERVTPMFARPM